MATFVARTLLAVSQSEVTYRLWVKPEEDPDGEPFMQVCVTRPANPTQATPSIH
jgi:hypothetical protein